MDEPSTTVFGRDARSYCAFRPPYPADLFAWLRSVSAGGELAWDCGTGGGQSAVGLARHFAHVLATDPDQRQLDQAPVRPNIHYRVAAAEADLGLSGEVDLITCACSIHWFDLARFYELATRALKPGGVLAAWTYDWPWTGSSAVDAALRKLTEEILGPFWSASSAYYFGRYETLPFPFANLESPKFFTSIAGADELRKFLSTWSAVEKFRQREGVDPLGLIEAELDEAWRAESPLLPLKLPLHMRAGVRPL